MKGRKTLVLVGTLVLGAMLFAFMTYDPQAQIIEQVQTQDATVVQRGQLSAQDRELSRAYKNLLYSYRRGTKFSDIIEKSERLGKTNVELGSFIGEPETVSSINKPEITAEQYLSNLVCQADAVVIGLVNKADAVMSEDETFIFTKYEFVVQGVLKNNSDRPIIISSSVELTRPGGVIILNNRRIRMEDYSYELLRRGQNYLLFLRYVPSANGYIVASPKGDFSIEGNNFRKLTKYPVPKALENNNDSQVLINEINRAVLSGCNGN